MGIGMSASVVLSCNEKEAKGSLGSPEDTAWSAFHRELQNASLG